MKRKKLFYIKERYNPQLGTYYGACGPMSKSAAKRMEKPLYGENFMHGFDTEEAYNARLSELRANGERVQQ